MSDFASPNRGETKTNCLTQIEREKSEEKFRLNTKTQIGNNYNFSLYINIIFDSLLYLIAPKKC